MLLALLELHAAHSDDLTHQEESLPHQVAAAQVLETSTNTQRERSTLVITEEQVLKGEPQVEAWGEKEPQEPTSFGAAPVRIQLP